MSRSKFAIYDRTVLRGMASSYTSEESERSILIGRWDRETSYYNEYNNRWWHTTSGPYPTPLIYLVQKRP